MRLDHLLSKEHAGRRVRCRLGAFGFRGGGGCGGGASFMDVRFVRGGSRVEHRLVDVGVVAGCCEYSCWACAGAAPLVGGGGGAGLVVGKWWWW